MTTAAISNGPYVVKHKSGWLYDPGIDGEEYWEHWVIVDAEGKEVSGLYLWGSMASKACEALNLAKKEVPDALKGR